MVYVNEGICDKNGTRELISQKKISETQSGVRHLVYYTKTRFFVSPVFYITNPEIGKLGPFESWVEANAEIEYLQDPLRMDYIPNQEYKVYYWGNSGKIYL